MNRSSEIFLAAAIIGATIMMILFPAVATGDGGPVPQPAIRMLDRYYANPGEPVLATGLYLNRRLVAELFLSDGQRDVRAELMKQSDGEIVFRVPDVPLGRYRIRLLVSGTTPKIVDQPVTLGVSRVVE